MNFLRTLLHNPRKLIIYLVIAGILYGAVQLLLQAAR